MGYETLKQVQGDKKQTFARASGEKEFFRSPWLHVLLISLVAVIAYSNTFHVPFHFDDHYHIPGKAFVRDIGSFFDAGLFQRHWHDHAFRVRTVGYLSLALNYRIHGSDVLGYHVVNLAIHIMNGILVYWLVVLTFRTPYFSVKSVRHNAEATPLSPPLVRGELKGGDLLLPYARFVALAAALLFVSHPVQTQAVTYIVQRLASLATLFSLLSLVLYVKWRLVRSEESGVSHLRRPAGAGSQESEQEIRDNPPLAKEGKDNPPIPPLARGGKGGVKRFSLYAASLVSLVLAMKTKEISFTVPVLIALYEFLFFEGAIKGRLLRLAPFFLTMAIIPLSLLGIAKPLGEVIGDVGYMTKVDTTLGRAEYLFTEFTVIVTYLRLLFFPVNQRLDYDYPVYSSFFDPPVLLSFLFLFALFGTAVYLLYRSRAGVTPPSPPYLRGGKKGALAKAKNDPRGGEEGLSSQPVTHHASRITAFCVTRHVLRLSAFGIFWFFITLSVESSIIPIADVIYGHRAYLPSVGFFIAVTAVLFVVWGRIARDTGSKSPSPSPSQGAVIVPTQAGGEVTPPPSAPPLNPPLSPLNLRGDERGGTGSDDPKGGTSPSLAKRGEGRFNEIIKRPAKIAMVVCGLVIVILSGATYARNSVWQSEVSLWQDMVKKSPMKPRSYNGLGLAYEREGRYDRALENFALAAGIDPAYALAYNGIGVVYFKQGLTGRAVEEFTRAIVLEPKNAIFHNNRGLAHAAGGEFDRAVADYVRAVELDPLYAEAFHNLGIAYHAEGLYQKAIEEYSQAISLQADDATFYSNRGLSYSALREFEKAMADFAKAVSLDPNFAGAYEGKGIVYGEMGHLSEALREFTLAISLEPSKSSLYVNRAVAYEHMRNIEMALSDFRKACGMGNEDGCRGVDYIGKKYGKGSKG